MPEYDISWGIDIDHDSPREAAQRALGILRSADEENLGLVFTVTDKDTGTVTTIDLSPGRHGDVDLSTDKPTGTCRHCQRTIVLEDGTWIDPEAPATPEDGDDYIWREVCDENHEDRIAAHEPYSVDGADAHGQAIDIAEQDAKDDAAREAAATSGPRTYTTTMTPEVYATLAAAQMTPATVVADMLTRDDADAGEIADAAIDAYRGDALRQHLIEQAADLLDPDEVHDNAEYLRGMVELIIRSTRWPDGTDSDAVRDGIIAAIEAHVLTSHAGMLSERATRQARGDAHYQG